MENGGLSDNFAGLTVNDAKDNSLSQVLKAVEAAEVTIKQQVVENNRLRAELQEKHQQLENIKSVRTLAQMSQTTSPLSEHGQGGFTPLRRDPTIDAQGILVLHQHLDKSTEDNSGGRFFPESHSNNNNKTNGSVNMIPLGHTNVDNSGVSLLSCPPTTSYSTNRFQSARDYENIKDIAGNRLMPAAGANNSSDFWKQNLSQKIREQEQEIIQLKRRITEYSVREAQMQNEKYVMEKRIAAMRMAFDQQQQDLVDAASKALSYRQDIIEDNVKLTYALQDAQQEKTIFVSSLLPLLAEYSLQPSVLDAQSIVSGVKVLFKHFQEKLNISELKLKDSQYQLTPWRSGGTSPSWAPQSPQQFSAAGLASGRNGLEIVPRPSYSSPIIATPDVQMATDWDAARHHAQLTGLSSPMARNGEHDDTERNPPVPGISPQGAMVQNELHRQYYREENTNRHVKFRDPVSSSDMDDSDADGRLNERDRPPNWGTGSSPYTNTANDPGFQYSPYLHPVAEEPLSSFSEAADDDPLPGIKDLQITGEALPGHELLACGYSINGTSSCNFKWVRHLEDGSVNYIDGAQQPTYLVTADDVDTYLAIEVQPLDDRKRKGELVRFFANDQRKITMDSVMHSHIEESLYNGQTSYTVSLLTGLDIWEPATLLIKREGYSIRCRGPSGVTAAEKFSPENTVSIMYGHPSEFSIITANGAVQILQAGNTIPDVVSSRDLIVLTLRLFLSKAGEKKKGKKKGLFFNK